MFSAQAFKNLQACWLLGHYVLLYAIYEYLPAYYDSGAQMRAGKKSLTIFHHAMTSPFIIKLLIVAVLSFGPYFTSHVNAEAKTNTQEPATAKELVLGKAIVCEAVKKSIPQNGAIAFSISLGRVYCFTEFPTVPEKMNIYHNWYHRDKKRAGVKLLLKPERWSTFSYVTVKKQDQGPWRVEVTDQEGNVLRTLRFSIID